jgi:hypothetical protein
MIKSRGMKWERSEVLAGNSEGKRPLGTLRTDGRIMLKL